MSIFTKKQKNLSYLDNTNICANSLEIILTKRCNLACEHCLRGNSSKEDITQDVLDKTFSKITQIEELCLGGGEISLKPELIKMVRESLIKNKTYVGCVDISTNGTVVSDELINEIKLLKDYVKKINQKYLISEYDFSEYLRINISLDNYHLNELEKIGFSQNSLFLNIAKYQKAFGRDAIPFRSICDFGVYNTGRAQFLKQTNKLTQKEMFYPIADYKHLSIIGGIITITTDGKVVPPNIAFEDENNLAYGNIKTDSLSNILRNMNTKQISKLTFNYYYRKMIKNLNSQTTINQSHKENVSKKLHYIDYAVSNAVEYLDSLEQER